MKSKTISELVHQLNESSIFVHFSLEKIEDKNYANVGYFFSDMERTLHCEAGVTQEYLIIEFKKFNFVKSMKEIDNWVRLVESYGIANKESFMFDIARVRTGFLHGVIG